MKNVTKVFLVSIVAGIIAFVLAYGQGFSLERSALSGGLGFVAVFMVIMMFRGKRNT